MLEPRIHRLLRASLLVCGLIGTSARAQSPGEELQRALTAEVAENPSLPGELLYVYAPARGVDVSLAAGVFDRESGRALEPRHGFRVASVTKTFVAAAILRLHAQGRIGLDDPIARHLPAEYVALLRGDGYAVDSITVRHLLTHTSGIHDYATDEQYFAAVIGEPMHRWTRMEQVRSAMAWGQPRFAPGAGYHYSDTGYVLLGGMLERLTGQPLPRALRTVLNLERLGLDETYMETKRSLPASELLIPDPKR